MRWCLCDKTSVHCARHILKHPHLLSFHFIWDSLAEAPQRSAHTSATPLIGYRPVPFFDDEVTAPLAASVKFVGRSSNYWCCFHFEQCMKVDS